MKGLFLKDFYIMRANILVVIISCIIITIGLSMLISPSVIIIMTAVPLCMTVTGTIISDKKTKWTEFASTLPVSKNEIISSKYITYILWSIIGIIFGTMVCMITIEIMNITDNNIIMFLGFSVIITLLTGSFTIPCNFMLSEEKSMIGTILAYSMTSGILALSIFIIRKVFNIGNINQTILIINIINIVVYLVSWYIAQKKIENFA